MTHPFTVKPSLKLGHGLIITPPMMMPLRRYALSQCRCGPLNIYDGQTSSYFLFTDKVISAPHHLLTCMTLYWMPDRTKFLNFQSIIYKSTDIFRNVSNSTQNVEVIALHKINGTVKKKKLTLSFSAKLVLKRKMFKSFCSTTNLYLST